MRSWSANDDPTGRPNWANVSTVYGVDKTEATLYGKGVTQGWVQIQPMSGYVSTITITNAGSGYANNDGVAMANGTTAGIAHIALTVDASNVTTINVQFTTGQYNIAATGASLAASFANDDTFFTFTNATSGKIYYKFNKVVNSTFANITTTFSTTNTTNTRIGLAAQISRIDIDYGGLYSAKVANTAITTNTGSGAVLTIASDGYGGRVGRTHVENMVAFKGNMAGDASDDTILPDA